MGIERASRPPRPVLLGLAVVALGSPLVARALGTPVGAYTMFARVDRYHLEVSARVGGIEQRVPLRVLEPHLSHAARRVILPGAGHSPGADQIDLLAGGLHDIGELVCRSRPEAESARVLLERSAYSRPDTKTREATVPCTAVR